MAKEIVSEKQSLATFKDLFEKQKGSFKAVVPAHMTPERIMKMGLVAMSRTPRLLECDSRTVLLALMQCAQLGLEPNTPLGLAYIIPFENRKAGIVEAQFIPGYRGLIKLAHQSGEVASIYARVVRRDDVFKVVQGTSESITHEPNYEVEESDGGEPVDPPMVAVYAVALLKGGTPQFDVMKRRQVDLIRNRSRAAQSGPWVTDYEEMAIKTVIRRLCKRLPLSTEMSWALEAQARAEAGDAPDYRSVTDLGVGAETKALTSGDALRDRVTAKAAEVAQGEEAPQ